MASGISSAATSCTRIPRFNFDADACGLPWLGIMRLRWCPAFLKALPRAFIEATSRGWRAQSPRAACRSGLARTKKTVRGRPICFRRPPSLATGGLARIAEVSHLNAAAPARCSLGCSTCRVRPPSSACTRQPITSAVKEKKRRLFSSSIFSDRRGCAGEVAGAGASPPSAGGGQCHRQRPCQTLTRRSLRPQTTSEP